jgi:(1->4)-alpha-D-glucan 1-alpha-D-glucosylmutase
MVNSLAQLALKLASPGVPDFYQGTELWDLSLVDPDNRGPVDYAARQALLDAMEPLFACLDAGETAARGVGELLDQWPDGRIKLLLTARGLRFRRVHAGLMLQGAYEPLDSEGAAARHLVAFARHDSSGTLIAVVPRLICSLPTGSHVPPRGVQAWGDTRVCLPDRIGAGRYRHLMTGETVDAVNGQLAADAMFRTLPVALLWSARNAAAEGTAT